MLTIIDIQPVCPCVSVGRSRNLSGFSGRYMVGHTPRCVITTVEPKPLHRPRELILQVITTRVLIKHAHSCAGLP